MTLRTNIVRGWRYRWQWSRCVQTSFLAAAALFSAAAGLGAGTDFAAQRNHDDRVAPPVPPAGFVSPVFAEGPPDLPLPLPAGVSPPPAAVDAAPVALLVDLGSGRTLYAHNPDRAFLPASVTKTMSAYVAFDMLAHGKLKPDEIFTESPEAWARWHNIGSRMFLNQGQPVTVDNLLHGMMTVSANDGTIVLAEGASGSVLRWVGLMNAMAQRLGMKSSHFGTPNGWMDKGNTWYTARDLVVLAKAMITNFPAYYHRYIGQPSMSWNGITQANHDPILSLPGADGIKTGWTNEAHYTFLGSSVRDGRRLVMVLAAVPTAWQRARAARALMEWGYSAWDTHRLFAAGQQVGTAKVQGGTTSQVALLAPRNYSLTMPKGSNPPVHLRIVYQGPLIAPITKGSTLAELEVHQGDDAAYRLPLVAGSSIEVGNFWDRFFTRLSRLFR